MAMALWDTIKHDHQEVETLFTQIENAKSESETERIFEQIKTELIKHSKAEEVAFYPELQAHGQTREMIPQALEEHQQVEQLLERLTSMPKGDAEWTRLCKELKNNVQQHVRFEEESIIPAAQQAVPQAKAEEMLRKFQAEKQAVAV